MGLREPGMAQSRPPPVRTYAVATSPPPLSPRTHSEKKHHTRRKSGKDYVVTSEKKSTRPAALSRRTTPQHITKVAPGYSSSRTQRDRDEDGGRDSGESFPQFWYVVLFAFFYPPQGQRLGGKGQGKGGLPPGTRGTPQNVGCMSELTADE